MKKTPPSAKLTAAADRHLKKLAVIIAFLPPLIDSLILFPLTQIVAANYGTHIIYQILSVLSQLMNLAGFFAAVALAVYCVFANALSALGRVIALQGIAYLSAVVVLRTFILWLLALIDDKLRLGFSFSNYTLNSLLESDGMMLIWSAISLFLNIIMLMLLIVIIVGIALLLRRKHIDSLSLNALADNDDGLLPPITLTLRIGSLIYVIQALANQIYDTVQYVSGMDTAQVMSSLASIISPFFLLAIYTFVGYNLMLWLIRRISKQALSLCQAG